MILGRNAIGVVPLVHSRLHGRVTSAIQPIFAVVSLLQTATGGARGGSPMNAIKLQKDVQKQLRWDPVIDSSKIGVAVADPGVVTLSGLVPSYLQKFEAEAAAKRVYGVRAVANDIEVQLPGAIKKTDAEIAESAVNLLKWIVEVPDDRIKLTVAKGVITLTGDVDYHFQKQAAERRVGALLGVVRVINQLSVKAPQQPPKPEEVQRDIEEALVRNARLDARGINVRTEDSRVVLEGIVRSWAESEEAEEAVWAAPGVVEVDNRLVVAS
jgi:osmotically-inducible protein OsmY